MRMDQYIRAIAVRVYKMVFNGKHLVQIGRGQNQLIHK